MSGPRDIRARLAQYRYVLVSTLVGVLTFVRNLVFMVTLGLADLGQVALMQTIVMLVGFVQFGTINGAYLLFSERKPDQTRRIAALLHAGLLLLAAAAAVLAAAGAGRVLAPAVAPQTLVIGVFAGLATLASTWMNNLLVAKASLARSNLINVAAVTASLAVAAASASYGLAAALGSMLLQPLLVAAGALLADPETRPRRSRIDPGLARTVWAAGFPQFLAGVAVLATYQIERWAIVALLGPEALGRFYPVMMFTAFFLLVPVALINVHLPQAVRAGGAGALRAIMRRHLAELAAYGAMALLATVILVPPLVRRLLPEFADAVPLLLLAFPGLMVMVLRDNATLALYAMRRTRPLLVSGGLLLVSYAALLAGAAAAGRFSLEAVVVLRGVVLVLSGIYLFVALRAALGRHEWGDGA